MLELFSDFSGFGTFHRTGKIDNLNFEGGLSFNRSSVSQVKDINIKANNTNNNNNLPIYIARIYMCSSIALYNRMF